MASRTSSATDLAVCLGCVLLLLASRRSARPNLPHICHAQARYWQWTQCAADNNALTSGHIAALTQRSSCLQSAEGVPEWLPGSQDKSCYSTPNATLVRCVTCPAPAAASASTAGFVTARCKPATCLHVRMRACMRVCARLCLHTG